MSIKLIINPFEPNGSCRGCTFSGLTEGNLTTTERGDKTVCNRPEGYGSCIVDSRYGLHFGIYVLAKPEKEEA